MNLADHFETLSASRELSFSHNERTCIQILLSELERYSEGNPIFADDLFATLEVENIRELKTVKKTFDHLVEASSKLPDLQKSVLERIEGYLPKADVIIDLVESMISTKKIDGQSLWEANQKCRIFVEKGILPRYERFIKRSLACHVINDNTIKLSIEEMISFLRNDYDPFATGLSNGLVSRAGRLNELLLERALANEGIGTKGIDYDMTGKKSQGDMAFYCAKVKPPAQLFAEIKSYAARERLLRGLQDLSGKIAIGVGFFTQPSEFNPARTQTYIDTGAVAIYLPDTTYDDVSDDSKQRVSKKNKPFYRKLSAFPGDMKHFISIGELP